MADETPPQSDGHRALDVAWFAAIDDLVETVTFNEDVRARIEAGDVLLRYFVSLGQSINEPYVPFDRPMHDEDEDE